jgi:hypothetical protein
MERRSKIAIVCIIAAIGVFGFVQYLLLSNLHVSIVQSKIMERTNQGTLYNLQLQFNNPSLLILNVGKTDFLVLANGENLGTGVLQPSTIPALGKTVSQTPFLADNIVLDKYNDSNNIPSLKLTGTSKYDLIFTSVNVPFTYYPTQQEARDFIHGT